MTDEPDLAPWRAVAAEVAAELRQHFGGDPEPVELVHDGVRWLGVDDRLRCVSVLDEVVLSPDALRDELRGWIGPPVAGLTAIRGLTDASDAHAARTIRAVVEDPLRWPATTPPSLRAWLTAHATGTVAAGFRVMGMRILPFYDQTWRFFQVFWLQLPTGPALDEMAARALLAILLQRQPHYPGGWGDYFDLDKQPPPGDAALHGPWPTSLIAPETFDRIDPAEASTLVVDFQTEGFYDPADGELPQEVASFVEHVLQPSLARSAIVFRLRDLGPDLRAVSGYGNYLELVSFDTVASELVLVVCADD